MGSSKEEPKGEKMREYSIEEIIGFLLNFIDDSYDNDDDVDRKLKVIEREKLKQLRRK